MQYIWEEKDILVGRYFIRGLTSHENSHEYAMSCLGKIGYTNGSSNNNLVAVDMTDGAAYPMGDGSKKEMAERLNDGNYVPMSFYEMAEFLIKYDRSSKKRTINYNT